MRYFPFFFDLQDKPVVVVGGGEDALRKIRLLLKTDAQIIVIATDLDPAVWELVDSEQIAWIEAPFSAQQLDGAACVISASDRKTGERVSEAAAERNIPVNVVDEQDLSTIIVPAIVDRDPVVVAIGTEGAGPVLAQGIRAHLESYLPFDLGKLAKKARELRPVVMDRLKPGLPRRQFWQSFFFGHLRNAYLKHEDHKFAQEFNGALKSPQHGQEVTYKVIVPENDDTDLLSLRAYRALQEADLIIYGDGHEHILDLARRDAVRLEDTDQAFFTDPQTAYGEHLNVVRIIDAEQFDWLPHCDVFPGRTICQTRIDVIPPSAQHQQAPDHWNRLLPAAAVEAEQWRLAS